MTASGEPPPGPVDIGDELLPLRPAVGVAVFNADGLVFLGRRLRGQVGSWQMPQGGIDEGEAPIEAALRELAEETGITDVAILGETSEWLTYDLPPGGDSRPRWATRYRGQRQRWFAVRFLGTDDGIDLATPHPEFDAWRWATLAEAVELVVAFKRPVYERVASEFARFAAHGARAASGRPTP